MTALAYEDLMQKCDVSNRASKQYLFSKTTIPWKYSTVPKATLANVFLILNE